MVTYKCDPCNYIGYDSSNYKRHLKSKKHLRNSATVIPKNLQQKSREIQVSHVDNSAQRNSAELSGIEKNSKKSLNSSSNKEILECENCGLTFKRAYNMNRHFKTCVKRKDCHRDKEYESKLKEKDRALKEKDRMLKEKNLQIQKMEKYYSDIINNIGNMGPRNINSITYIIGNYDNAPHLETIQTDNLQKLSLKTNRDIENIICAHKNNLLIDQIIEAILLIYKKKDPTKQSVWVTDTSRHNYIIKELLHDDDSRWVIDKKGVKSEKYLVKPILDHIRKIVFEYLQTSPNLLDDPKLSKIDRNIILDCQHNGSNLIKQIDDNTIGPEIIKKLSKHIHHKKSKQPVIEEIE